MSLTLPKSQKTTWSVGRWLALPISTWSAAVILLLLFAHLGGEIGEGETLGFDSRCLEAAQALRATWPWLGSAMRDWSGVGSTVVLSFVTITACGYLGLAGAWRVAVVMALSALSAAVVVALLKSAFARTRPEPAFAEYVATGLSFPSGHTSMSTVVFLTLAMLLARSCSRAKERVYVIGTGAALAALVGVSRAALGVHWATDVIGGWAFGIAWATAWWLVANRFVTRQGIALPIARQANE